jgi:hypothetical protein
MRTTVARGESVCSICGLKILIGNQTSYRPAYGWVHSAGCVTAAPRSPSRAALSLPVSGGFNDLIDGDDEPAAPEPVNETPAEATARAVREGMGLPAASAATPAQNSEAFDRIERKLFDELKRSLGDQNRLAKGMIKGEIATAFEATVPLLLKDITGTVKDATSELVKLKLEEARKEFKLETARAIQKIASSGVVRQEITIIRPDRSKVELAGEVFHPKFDRILRLASAGKPIFLPGPTGCGKTHLATQVARAIYGDKWQDKFGILSCSPATAERHFLGRSIPKITTGEEVYRAAEFVNIYENGGVFCADEIDAADASTLLVFNAALANGFLPVPDRVEKPVARRHSDFVFIACANTWGRGADRRYVGRNPLDEATLDRFRIGTVPLNYSPAIERVKCPDTDLFDTLTAWRKAIFDGKLERIMSTRFFGDAYDMLTAGDSMQDITASFFSGWRKEEVIKVLGRELAEEEQ